MLRNSESSFIAGEAIVAGARVKLSGSTANTIVNAGIADQEIGTAMLYRAKNSYATGEAVSVALMNNPGSRHMLSAGAVACNSLIRRAASGKVDDSGAGAVIGIALEAATATDQLIECILSSESVSVTDSTGGTASSTLAAGVGIETLAFPIELAQLTGSMDVVTNFVPGYKFKVLSAAFVVTVPVTTASKLATLNLEIGSTNLTGGTVALTSATCTPLGAQVSGAAITALNTGTSTDTLSVEVSGVTAFAEGKGILLVQIQNMDTADAFASLAAA